MEKPFPEKKLIAIIGGYREVHENRKSWLTRVAKTAGISVRQAYKAFYEGDVSSKTQQKLENAARKKVSEDDSELVLRLHSYARYLESVDAEMFRADIEAARRIASRYQDHTSENSYAPLPPWFLPDF